MSSRGLGMNHAWLQPEKPAEVLAALAEHGPEAKLLAGGTAMVLLLQQKLIAPGVLVDLGRVSELDAIRLAEDGLHIGPMTRLRDIEWSRLVAESLPALARACGSVGNVRIRNQATLGGCLAEADYASDPPAVLLALDAEIRLEKAGGARTLPIREFALGFYSTALQPDEMITDIRIPPLPASSRTAYLRFKARSSEDRPCLSVAVVADLEDRTCRELRIALGAATEAPLRMPRIEALAKGRAFDDELISEVAEQYASQTEPIEDLRASAWYRKQMIQVYVRRALQELRDDDQRHGGYT